MLDVPRSKSEPSRQLWITFVLVLAFFSISSPAAAQLGGKPEKSVFTVSYTQPSGAFTPLWVAQQNGLFKKHGLDASLKLLNSQVALQALVAGEVDVISSGPDLVNARLQNVPVKYIGASLQRFIFQLWGAKGIGSLTELKGKTIAVTTPRTSTEIAAREALKKTGVITEKDVSFIYVQTVPAILTAIINGKTSAGTLSAPNTLKARDAGLNLLIDIAHINVSGLHLAYGTTEKTIKSDPNTLYAFMKATAEATVLARQNPAVAKRAIGKFTHTTDAKMIDGTYEQFSPYWDANLALHTDPIQSQLMYLDEKEFPRAKEAQASEFIDNTFADDLMTSGFLQSLEAAK